MQQLKAFVAAKRKFVDFDYEGKKTFLVSWHVPSQTPLGCCRRYCRRWC